MTQLPIKYRKLIDRIEVTELSCDSNIERNYWHASILSADTITITGGYSESPELAIQIGLAELIERYEVNQLSKDPKLKKEFFLDTHNSSCGFAAGFSSSSTQLRAIAEAVERWGWSKWIDDGFSMQKLEAEEVKSLSLPNLFTKNFNELICFKKAIPIRVNQFLELDLSLCVLLGLTEDGVFPGSRVDISSDLCWSHAALEAWRHFHISLDERSRNRKNFPFNRIHCFANNKSAALSQIPESDSTNRVWPIPRVLTLKKVRNLDPSIHVWRCLIDNYINWNSGDEKRFVY